MGSLIMYKTGQAIDSIETFVPDYSMIHDDIVQQRIKANNVTLISPLYSYEPMTGENRDFIYYINPNNDHKINAWGDDLDTAGGLFMHYIHSIMHGGVKSLEFDDDGYIKAEETDRWVSIALSFFGSMFAILYFMLTLITFEVFLPSMIFIPAWLKTLHALMLVPVYIYLAVMISPYAMRVIRTLADWIMFWK